MSFSPLAVFPAIRNILDVCGKKPSLKGKLSTVDLLGLTRLNQLIS